MRFLLTPGGVVGARVVDWGSATFYPENPGIARFLALYYELARRDGGEPNAGRHLPRWLREAGFVDLRVSTSSVSYMEPTAIQAWADSYAEAMVQSNFAKKALEYGLATHSDLAGISAAWQSLQECFQRRDVCSAIGRIDNSTEAKPAAESIVLDDLNCRTAEFVSELDVMTSRLPGVIGDEMPVRVHARSRD